MRTLVKIFLFLSIFSLIIFSTDLFFPYITGKIFAFRFFIEFAFIAWILDLFLRKTLRFRFSEPIVKALLIFSGSLIVSAFFGVNPSFSFWSDFERSEGLFSFFHYLAFFIMLLDVFVMDDYYRLIKAFLIISPFIAYYQFSNYVNIEKHAFGRINGLLGNPSYVATFLLFVFGLGFYLVLKNRELFRSTKDVFVLFENWLWCLILLIDIPAFFFTQTRGAYVGVFVALVVYLIMLGRYGVAKEKKMARYSLLFLSIFIVLGSVLILKTNVLPSNLKDPGSLVSRFSTWKAALRGFLDRPLLGYGPENFNIAFDRHYDPVHSGLETWFDHAHNLPVELLAVTGVVGFLAYLYIFYIFFRYYFSIILKKRPIYEAALFLAIPVAYFIQNLALFDSLTSYVLFFTFLALARTIVLRETNTYSTNIVYFGRPLFIGLCCIILFFAPLFGIYSNIFALQKNMRLLATFLPPQQSFSPSAKVNVYKQLFDLPGFVGRREISTALAKDIFDWSSSRNLSKFSREDFDALNEGINMSEEYLTHDPSHIRNYYLLGYAYSSIGGYFKDRKALIRGEDILKRADKLSPGRIEFLEVLIKNLGAQKKYDEALKYSLEIIRLRPDMEAGHRFAGVFYQKIGETKKGKEELGKALLINPSSTASIFLEENK
ncbi:MAG: O-antigen ligase family protein [Parcubacteria group bacterium]|nr:O-antigen ligase family protein [Parcubacteria group bacterium]